MKSNEAILDKHLYNRFDETDRKTFISAMKEAQVEAIKEILKRHLSQDIFDPEIKWKSISDVSLELIKEIES